MDWVKVSLGCFNLLRANAKVQLRPGFVVSFSKGEQFFISGLPYAEIVQLASLVGSFTALSPKMALLLYQAR